jgi:hypothetical protein
MGKELIGRDKKILMGHKKKKINSLGHWIVKLVKFFESLEIFSPHSSHLSPITQLQFSV